jgi:hypothetical protein
MFNDICSLSQILNSKVDSSSIIFYFPQCPHALGGMFATPARWPGCALQVQCSCLLQLAQHWSLSCTNFKAHWAWAVGKQMNWPFFHGLSR